MLLGPHDHVVPRQPGSHGVVSPPTPSPEKPVTDGIQSPLMFLGLFVNGLRATTQQLAPSTQQEYPGSLVSAAITVFVMPSTTDD